MKSKRYRIANKVVEINSIYDEVHKYCAEYQTEDVADYSITSIKEDIEFEKHKYENEKKIEGTSIENYSDSYFEELAVYRKIAEKMLDYDTILFHGSVVAVNGEGYLFTAKSGTGKSTHTKLWCEYLKNKAIMVNDDKPLIHIADKIIVYGTPYNGKHRIGCNMSVPLKSICVLTRAKENSIKKITRQEAYTLLVQQVYRPEDVIKMKKTLKLIDKLADNVTFYILKCNTDISAAKIAYEGMRGSYG